MAQPLEEIQDEYVQEKNDTVHMNSLLHQFAMRMGLGNMDNKTILERVDIIRNNLTCTHFGLLSETEKRRVQTKIVPRMDATQYSALTVYAALWIKTNVQQAVLASSLRNETDDVVKQIVILSCAHLF
jgi:hypothetical protein